MHTIGCPATSFFLPKLKNASVLTTDPLPPAVRSGVRDLEACLRWEKREKTEGERERVSVFVRVDARKYKTYLLEFVFVQLFLHVIITFVSRAKCDRDFEDERNRAHKKKEARRDWLTVNTFFLTKKFGCAMNVLEVAIFINSLFVMMCFEWDVYFWRRERERRTTTRISFVCFRKFRKIRATNQSKGEEKERETKRAHAPKKKRRKEEKTKGKKKYIHSKSRVTRLCRRRADTRFHKRWLLLSWNRYISLIPRRLTI